jgi:hypothetical protein
MCFAALKFSFNRLARFKEMDLRLRGRWQRKTQEKWYGEANHCD